MVTLGVGLFEFNPMCYYYKSIHFEVKKIL